MPLGCLFGMRNHLRLLSVAAALACGGTATTGTSGTVPDFYKAFSGSGVSVRVDGQYVVITSTGVPDHKSPYFGTASSQYEAYNGSNPAFQLTPTSSERRVSASGSRSRQPC